MSWYEAGKDAVDAATRSGGSDFSSFRFFLKAKQEALIAFCDGENVEGDSIIHYKEHSFSKRSTKAPGFATCWQGTGTDCPLCAAGLTPYDAWPLTIIQIEPTWTDKEGKVHTNQKKLIVVKKEMMQRVLRFIEQREGLTGTKWNIHRSGKTAYTVGDDWQFQTKVEGGRAGLAKDLGVEETLVQPLDYLDLLKPKTLEELKGAGADIEATLQREAEWAARDKGNSGGSSGGSSGSSGGDSGGSREGRSAGVRY